MALSAKTGSPGFTLLEILIALFIIALVIGTATIGARNVFADEDLHNAVRELQICAKTARKEALDLNRDQELLLLKNAWELHQIPNSSDTQELADPPKETKSLSYQLPENITFKIKRWGSSKWETPDKLSWIFTAAGLSAPHRFRFERKNSWIEISFNPLTANPQQEEFYLP